MKKFTMYNSKTNVTITTIEDYVPQWEKLGFVVIPSVRPLLKLVG